MSSVGCNGLPSSGGTRVSGNADAVISATRSDSTRPSPVSTLRSLTRAAPSSATVFRDRRQIAKRSEEHTSELQSLAYLVCRLLLEKKNLINQIIIVPRTVL